MSMPTYKERSQARNNGRDRARHLIVERQITQAPVPVEAIAESMGFQIARHRFDGPESGFALHDGNQSIIGVNIQTSRRRQRFTIAHELGHLLMHEGRPLTIDQSVLRIDLRNDLSSMATDLQEIEANTFAATLLMPDDIAMECATIALQTNGEIGRDDLITQLARKFDVSIEAMGFRLISLGILTA